jgi:hypothetical protein
MEEIKENFQGQEIDKAYEQSLDKDVMDVF